MDADLIGDGASYIVQHLQLESADADRKRRGPKVDSFPWGGGFTTNKKVNPLPSSHPPCEHALSSLHLIPRSPPHPSTSYQHLICQLRPAQAQFASSLAQCHPPGHSETQRGGKYKREEGSRCEGEGAAIEHIGITLVPQLAQLACNNIRSDVLHPTRITRGSRKPIVVWSSVHG